MRYPTQSHALCRSAVAATQAIAAARSAARQLNRAQVGQYRETKFCFAQELFVSRYGMACLTHKKLGPKIAKALKG